MLSVALFLLTVTARLAWAAPMDILVRELGTRDPVPEALLSLPALSRTASADAEGHLQIDLPEGPHFARLSAAGFGPRSLTLNAASTTRHVYLRRTELLAEAVVVRGRRETAAPSQTAISRKEIRRIAGIGRDPLRALQTLPGVVAASDFSGQLAVRGGGPQDNLYYLDRVPWPVPFHFGGALSTVPSDALEGVDLYPANFPARWGGVDGAILDARLRKPDKNRWKTSLDVNLLMAEGVTEGPLFPPSQPPPPTGKETPVGPSSPLAGGGQASQDNSQRASWLIGGRRSYFELLLPLVSSGFTAFPKYWDAIGIVDVPLGKRDNVKVLALATDDQLALEIKAEDVRSKDFAGEFKFRNSYQTLGVNWEHLQGGWKSVFTPYAYQVSFEFALGQGYFLTTFPIRYGVKEEVSVDLGDHELGLGTGIEYTQYNVHGFGFRRTTGGSNGAFTVTDPAGITITAYALAGFGYLQDRWKIAPSFAVAAGLRFEKSDQVASEALDPRIALEWKPWSGGRLSAGWGLFTSFPTPQQTSRDFGNPGLSAGHTEHIVAGIEQQVAASTLVRVEAYDKTFGSRVVVVPDARIYANEGEGSAKGLELFFKHEAGERFFGWLSYSYSVSERKDGLNELWKPYVYDQPHTATLVGSYNLSPAWSSGLKLTWHSGPLITPVVGRVPNYNPQSTTGWSPVYGAPYSERLDDYVRLDVRSDYAVDLPGWRLNFYLEIINLLGRENPSGVTYNKDYSVRQNVNNLPRLPYVGMGLEF